MIEGGAAWGWHSWYNLEVPKEIYLRGQRLLHRYGRSNYVDDWCKWQLRKQLIGTP